jgi:apolipoprotein N-acyltransferase
LGGFAWTIGHSQAFSGWGAGWTVWGGSYAVSFGIVLANTLLFKAFNEKRSRILFLFMFFTVISAGYLSGRQKPDQTQNKSLRICSVQPSISPNEKIDPLNLIPSLEKHLALSETCFDSKPDLIVWPETAVTDDVVNELGLNAVITGFVKEKNVPIVVGSAMLIDGKDKNSAVFFSPVDDVRVYHKQSLIPFMEKCPFRSGTLKKAFCENDFEAARTAGMFVLKGEPSYPFGTAICSEDNHPNIFRDLKSRGALLTLVVFNDARLNSIPAYKMQLQNSVMQSMAFRMPILRVGNSGITAYIDEFGRITTRNNSLGIDDVFAYSFNVHPHTGSTFYAKYGDFFAWSCLIFVIIFELIKIVFRRKQGYEKIST